MGERENGRARGRHAKGVYCVHYFQAPATQAKKISVVEFDPGTLLDARLDSECLPLIEAMDLFSYLGLDTNLYYKEQFKASKSLESFNFLGLGFITITSYSCH